jgi:endonuclease YncB( thermonuclease family)
MTTFRFRSSIVAIFVSLTAAFALQQVPSDPPKPFTGKVVSISDGDTVTVLLDRTQHKIRLEHIDAPESGQATLKLRLPDGESGSQGHDCRRRSRWRSGPRFLGKLGFLQISGTLVAEATVYSGGLRTCLTSEAA